MGRCRCRIDELIASVASKIEAAKAEAQGTRLAEPSSQLFLELILFRKKCFLEKLHEHANTAF